MWVRAVRAHARRERPLVHFADHTGRAHGEGEERRIKIERSVKDRVCVRACVHGRGRKSLIARALSRLWLRYCLLHPLVVR